MLESVRELRRRERERDIYIYRAIIGYSYIGNRISLCAAR